MTETDTLRNVVPEFNSMVGQSGIHIHDPIEEVQTLLFTDRSVTPRAASTDGFAFPVDSAAEVTLSEIRTQVLLRVWIRDVEGNKILASDPEGGTEVLPAGDYLLELTGLGMKIYARVLDAGFRVKSLESSVAIDFSEETTIRLGARSLHSQPGRTLTTRSEPEDLMQAVSLFGNAMKTWSAERTFPSLRGHPPLLEIGDENQIPDQLSPPDTGIELTVPAEHSWLYPAVPLIYWLGATVRPGPPKLKIGSNNYPIGVDSGYQSGTDREAFEKHVKDILQFTFMLDCAVRTEGFYDVELDARRRIEAIDLPLDFERLYDEPIKDRVQRYLELDCSFSTLANRVGRPGWRLTADVESEPERATTLPFLARDLAVIRCPTEAKLAESSEDVTEGMEEVFSRRSPTSGGSGGAETVSGGSVASRASSSGGSFESTGRERIIGLPEADSMSQTWIGDGFAVGAAKASTQSYLRRLESHSKDSDRISINVIVNDENMSDEATVSDIYGTRDHLNFNIQVHQNLSSDELAEVFETETDFIHYVGHVDPEGFDCANEYLHADQLGTVGADTFVLNACASYEQGQLLVDKGAIAGVVTLEDVINSLATKVGKKIARLLNYGFPIGSATGLIQETIFTGSNYVVVGDSNASLAQSNVAVPNVSRVSLRGDGLFDVSVETFASWNFDVGSMHRPFIEGCECDYVVPGELDTWRVDDAALNEYLNRYTLPIIGGGSLFWSDQISAETLRERLQSYA